MSSFVGVWTYRSFHNLPSISSFDELKFAEAELTLEETENGEFVIGRLSFGSVYLNIVGTVTLERGNESIRMRATGVESTVTANWIYDYVGFLAPSWEHADSQRPVIVGTVIRSVPHDPDRLAGYTASFIAVHRTLPTTISPLPENVIKHFSGKIHRLHHAVWHGVRNSWELLPSATKQKLIHAGWETSRPARTYGKDRNFKTPCVNNNSGEDFLFFHRQMVVAYKQLMDEAGVVPIEWTTIPEPGAVEFPGSPPQNDVPPAWPMPENGNFERRLKALKSDVYYWTRMRWWDQQFKNPTYLTTLTLGQLGSILEYSVHNDMHMRWSAAPRDPVTNATLVFGRPQNNFEDKWDLPKYDWLGEFYSSHVNPIFWRLHGWIDDRIDDWFNAHESIHPGEIVRITKGGVSWFEPGKWVMINDPWVWPSSLGGYEGGHLDHEDAGMHHGGGHDDLNTRRLASLKVVAEILYPPEVATAAATELDMVPEDIPFRALSPVFGLND